MTDHHILLVGPPLAEAAIADMRQVLVEAGQHMESHVGRIQDIVDTPLWRSASVAWLVDGVCGAAEMDAAPNLHTIIIPTLGYEGVDIEQASIRGIAVANGKVPEHVQSVAEAAILFMLMHLYEIDGAREQLKAGQTWYGIGRTARMLGGATVGVIGYGEIARAVISRLRAFGSEVLVHNRTVPSTPPDGVRFVDLDTLVTQSDIVVPLVALTPETHLLLSADRLSAMKPGALLVNLGRGALVDQNALVGLANAGKIRVALDVYETEPLPMGDPIRDIPGAILTAHAVAQTVEGLQAMRRRAVENTLRGARAVRLDNPLNPDALGRWPQRLDAERKGEEQ